jgi:hypothetical protein
MPIEPPDRDKLPKWARVLVQAANARNRLRGAETSVTMEDLVAAWTACGGRCAVSGMPFNLQVVGDGAAKRPFAPSLDRIDRHKPYQRDNVRLVVSIANFAMNAWGDEPLLQLATALGSRNGSRSPPARPAPSDADLDDVATIDTELAETDIGMIALPPRPDLHQPILDLLQQGPRSSRELEQALADGFGIAGPVREARLGNGHPAWRNHVAWALVDLVRHRGGRGGTGQIERIGGERAPDGGTMGIYRLTGRALPRQA